VVFLFVIFFRVFFVVFYLFGVVKPIYVGCVGFGMLSFGVQSRVPPLKHYRLGFFLLLFSVVVYLFLVILWIVLGF